MTTRLATINIEATDPQRSKRFYIDVLGMRENEARSHSPDFVYLESDGMAITLAHRENVAESPLPCSSIEIGFATDDLAAVRRHLATHDVGGFAAQQMGWGAALEGRDYDGWRVIIYELSS